jgi:hypothetical protein
MDRSRSRSMSLGAKRPDRTGPLNTTHRAEVIRWVSENVRPFSIVNDCSFKNLMKTGRPEYYLPSPTTVSHDVRLVFARSQQHIASLLCVSKYPEIDKKAKQCTEI